MEYGIHFRTMMKEREIPEEWVAICLEKPDNTELHSDGTKHYLRQIPEFGDRWLRVVINTSVKPPQAITLFFDRRLRKQL